MTLAVGQRALGFTTDHLAGLFLTYGAALMQGVAGPVAVTVGFRQGSLSDVGLCGNKLQLTANAALLLAAVQCSLTLWATPCRCPETGHRS